MNLLKDTFDFFKKTILEALIGIIVALVVMLISHNILIPFFYEIFVNTVNLTGVVKSVFTIEEILSGEGFGVSPAVMRILNQLNILNTWLILFGIRFVVNYIVKGVEEKA